MINHFFKGHYKSGLVPVGLRDRRPASDPCRRHSSERQLLRGGLQLKVSARARLPESGQHQGGQRVQAGECAVQEEQTPLRLHLLHCLEPERQPHSHGLQRQDHKACQVYAGP